MWLTLSCTLQNPERCSKGADHLLCTRANGNFWNKMGFKTIHPPPPFSHSLCRPFHQSLETSKMKRFHRSGHMLPLNSTLPFLKLLWQDQTWKWSCSEKTCSHYCKYENDPVDATWIQKLQVQSVGVSERGLKPWGRLMFGFRMMCRGCWSGSYGLHCVDTDSQPSIASHACTHTHISSPSMSHTHIFPQPSQHTHHVSLSLALLCSLL